MRLGSQREARDVLKKKTWKNVKYETIIGQSLLQC